MKNRMTQSRIRPSETASPPQLRSTILSLVIFFAISYTLMFVSVLGSEYRWFEFPGAVRLLLSVGSPTLAAFAVVLLFEGWPGLRNILAQYVQFRAPITCYMFGALFFVIPLLYGLVRVALSGDEVVTISPTDLAALALFTFIVGPLSEEGGWRGYALPRMLKILPPANAAALLGLLWGCWHLPFWYVEGSYQQQIPFVGFIIASVLLSIVYAKVYLAAHHGLAPVIHLHFWINFAGSLLMRRLRLVNNIEFLVIELTLIIVLSAYVLFTGLRKID